MIYKLQSPRIVSASGGWKHHYRNSICHDMIYHNYYKQIEVFERYLQNLAIDDVPANIQINSA